MNAILQEVTQDQLKQREAFKVGDGVRVHQIIREGDKERVQIFAGIVIAIQGSGINQNFIVRRISFGQGVEKLFPMHSPNIQKSARMRRARLYYLRGRTGKDAVKVQQEKR